jgi:bifunctional UDP-N-acetylglucosamine pyrophosphorylase/glucosamine-1-phosphate N-acetyltransferase
MSVKAVIISAGFGNRMSPLTIVKPKPMIPIMNKPILDHTIQALKNVGINDIIIVTNPMSYQIKDYVQKRNYGLNINFATQNFQLGTADAIHSAQSYINKDEKFIALNGNSIINEYDIKKLIESCYDNTLCLQKTVNKDYFDIITETSNDKIINLVTDPTWAQIKDIKYKTDNENLYVHAGVYKFNYDIFNYIENMEISINNEYDITDAIRLMIRDRYDFGYHRSSDEYIRIMYPWDLLEANKYMLNNLDQSELNGNIESNVTLHGIIKIEDEALLMNGTYIEGPVSIGRHCVIGPNCYIGSNTTIGDYVRIGNGVTIENSIIMQNSNIGHQSYIGYSVIGDKCNIGAGTKTSISNIKQKRIFVCQNKKKIDTGLFRLGTIMSDKCRIGINNSIYPGSLIDPSTKTHPGQNID